MPSHSITSSSSSSSSMWEVDLHFFVSVPRLQLTCAYPQFRSRIPLCLAFGFLILFIFFQQQQEEEERRREEDSLLTYLLTCSIQFHHFLWSSSNQGRGFVSAPGGGANLNRLNSGKRTAVQETGQGLEEIPVVENLRLYSYKELRNATGDFSPRNKVGEGGFGSVYKGTLKDGTAVAIKVLSSESTQGVREFLTEITVISYIDHENLVTLYGCCVEKSHRILVYNYLENNSLAQTLLGTNRSNIQFSWRTRSRICLGVARGLAFLHEEVRPHIVHRDIKASNILLDTDLTPKISDFGLAKLLPPNITHVSTRVAGTIGYLAPEYAIRGQVTKKSDVYSFGVLLLEVVSGRCNINTRLPYEEHYLLDRTWALYEQGELLKIVDTSLSDSLDTEEACRFLKIALLCTQDVSKRRPSMSTVVKMLTGERDVESEHITKPGLLSDFMDLKIRGNNKAKEAKEAHNTSSTMFSGASSSQDTTRATMSFPAISDRD